MNKNRYFTIAVGATLAVLGGMHYSAASYDAEPRMITPANMPRIGTVDERFQSYNVEMVEVIGGRFWKPYQDVHAVLKKPPPSAQQPGSDVIRFHSGSRVRRRRRLQKVGCRLSGRRFPLLRIEKGQLQTKLPLREGGARGSDRVVIQSEVQVHCLMSDV